MDFDVTSILGKKNYLVNETLPSKLLKIDQIESKFKAELSKTIKLDEMTSL